MTWKRWLLVSLLSAAVFLFALWKGCSDFILNCIGPNTHC